MHGADSTVLSLFYPLPEVKAGASTWIAMAAFIAHTHWGIEAPFFPVLWPIGFLVLARAKSKRMPIPTFCVKTKASLRFCPLFWHLKVSEQAGQLCNPIWK